MMGAAKQRQQQQDQLLARLTPAVEQVAAALKKFAVAASNNLGVDCYLHAVLGQALLADLGIKSDIVVGYASWRVGKNDGDVVSHAPGSQTFLPEGAQGAPYHAWLEHDGFIIDMTTYQLRRKAADLDAMDGGRTTVDWCPEVLILPRSHVRSYRDVAQLDAGMAYYEPVPQLQSLVSKGFVLDEEDLATARTIMALPNVAIVGPASEKNRHHTP